MLTYSDAVCKQVNARLAHQKDTPEGVFADPTGNVAKSRECGCQICSLVCDMLDESGNEQAETKIDEAHRDVRINFSGAGMSVERIEAFVTDCESKHLFAVEDWSGA
jgi:hypothetical protein